MHVQTKHVCASVCVVSVGFYNVTKLHLFICCRGECPKETRDVDGQSRLQDLYYVKVEREREREKERESTITRQKWRLGGL